MPEPPIRPQFATRPTWPPSRTHLSTNSRPRAESRRVPRPVAPFRDRISGRQPARFANREPRPPRACPQLRAIPRLTTRPRRIAPPGPRVNHGAACRSRLRTLAPRLGRCANLALSATVQQAFRLPADRNRQAPLPLVPASTRPGRPLPGPDSHLLEQRTFARRTWTSTPHPVTRFTLSPGTRSMRRFRGSIPARSGSWSTTISMSFRPECRRRRSRTR